MTHLADIALPNVGLPLSNASHPMFQTQPTVLLISDTPHVVRALDNVCDFLGIGIEIVSSAEAIDGTLSRERPMAVIAELEGAGQDGCHVMMRVADHDPTLPVLLLTGHDPAMLGAAEAVEELWQLSSVRKVPELPDAGQLLDFLFGAGRRGTCISMMPV